VAIRTTSPTTAARGAHRRLLVACALSLLTVPLFAGVASAADFSNPAPITVPLPGIPEGCPTPNGCPSERAIPFPSNIVVSGLTGSVIDVKVTLRDLTYPLKPADADILLVAPGGRSVMLMSDACGDNSEVNENPINSPITLTFDDRAPALLPADGVCTSGTFRPIDDDDDANEFPLHGHGDDVLPGAPAPPAITQPLSTFNGINPNGTWSLYVVDDYPNDPDPAGFAGRIAGGWTISIATEAGDAPTPVAAQEGTGATTTTGAGGGATGATTTTAAGGTTTTAARTGAAGSGSQATTTTTTPLPNTGGESVRLSAVGALLIATGLLMFQAMGPERRRRAQIYIVHFGR